MSKQQLRFFTSLENFKNNLLTEEQTDAHCIAPDSRLECTTVCHQWSPAKLLDVFTCIPDRETTAKRGTLWHTIIVLDV